jgi:hypothetical protein
LEDHKLFLHLPCIELLCQESKDDPVDSDAEEDDEEADEASHDSDADSKTEAGEDSDENKEDVHVSLFIPSNLYLNQA